MLSEAVYVYTRNADLRPRQSSWFDGLVRFYLIMLKIIDQIIQNKLLVDNRWSSKALKKMDILLSLRFGIFEKSPLGDFLERFEKKISKTKIVHQFGPECFWNIWLENFSRGYIVISVFLGGILW